MSIAALITWIITAGFGFFMLIRWATRGGLRRVPGAETHLPPVRVFSHFGLAAAGLVVWIVYLVTGSTVLANRIDSMTIHYFDQKVTYTAPPGGSDITNVSAAEVSPANAKYIVIAISVTLDAIGTPAEAGYQPPYSVLLCSDVTLRNSGLWSY